MAFTSMLQFRVTVDFKLNRYSYSRITVSKMVSLLIYSLLVSASNCLMISKYRKFEGNGIGSVLPQFTFAKTQDSKPSTLIQCGAACSAKKGCGVYAIVYEKKECWLGTLGNQGAIWAPTQPDSQSIYIEKGKNKRNFVRAHLRRVLLLPTNFCRFNRFK